MATNGFNNLYEPLGEEQIRLITIHPELTNGIVSCSLESFSLEETTPAFQQFLHSYGTPTTSRRWLISTWRSIQRAKGVRHPPATRSMKSFTPSHNHCFRYTWGDFAAMSYVWGTDHAGKVIVNGQEMAVTKNLEYALEELRSDEARFSKRYKLWVDAICINQSDEEETAEQVSRMREIYTEAWAVVAWLGPAKENTDQGMHLLATLSCLNDKERDNLSALLENNPTTFGEFAFYGLHNLMTSDYWRRLWIIQELVLGSSSTILRCGKDTLDWPTFCRGISVLYHGGVWSAKDWLLRGEMERKQIAQHQHWVTSSIHLVHQNLRPLSEFESLQFRAGERQGMRKLLELAMSESREEKDKVFGLLGMMEPKISKRLICKYSKPTAELFSATSIAFIEHYGNLEPLREANPWGKADTPSWVVDWTWKGRLRYSKPESVFIGAFWTPGTPEPRADAIYSAAGQREPLCSVEADGRLLRTNDAAFAQFESLGWSWMKEQQEYYFRWVRWHQAHDGIRMGNMHLGDYFTDQVPCDASEFDYAEVYRATDRSGMGRRLMFTQKVYLGWGPDNAHGSLQDQIRVGDMVCIVYGCSTPLVIRRVEDKYHVLGEAYLEGMMDGEAVDSVESGELPEEELIFC
ncbi:HET-domain-containing [Fusarium albosuccineum]|uniref:HET-domain-containing n=1 Tax=Fusarium albosuccineum TaxID=1237068 RepID=A0A8H4PG96_9HYPO|nr:HET-domain-containing [Fusarium albosuccineum]